MAAAAASSTNLASTDAGARARGRIGVVANRLESGERIFLHHLNLVQQTTPPIVDSILCRCRACEPPKILNAMQRDSPIVSAMFEFASHVADCRWLPLARVSTELASLALAAATAALARVTCKSLRSAGKTREFFCCCCSCFHVENDTQQPPLPKNRRRRRCSRRSEGLQQQQTKRERRFVAQAARINLTLAIARSPPASCSKRPNFARAR